VEKKNKIGATETSCRVTEGHQRAHALFLPMFLTVWSETRVLAALAESLLRRHVSTCRRSPEQSGPNKTVGVYVNRRRLKVNVKLSSLPIRTLLAATLVMIGMTGVCFAQTIQPFGGSFGPRPVPIKHAPEIDPASATTAFALLAGVLLVIRGRRR